MKKTAVLSLLCLLALANPLSAKETLIHFDCGVYYFSEGLYATEVQFQNFTQVVERALNDDFDKAEGEVRGTIKLTPEYFMGDAAQAAGREFSQVHPAVFFMEGSGGAKIFSEFQKNGTYPRILIFLNAPDAGQLVPDFPLDKRISIFGEGAPETSHLEIKDPKRDFNLRIKGASHVNLWQDEDLQKFVSDVVKIALFESLFKDEQTKEPV